jgi:hypothetical protein
MEQQLAAPGNSFNIDNSLGNEGESKWEKLLLDCKGIFSKSRTDIGRTYLIKQEKHGELYYN